MRAVKLAINKENTMREVYIIFEEEMTYPDYIKKIMQVYNAIHVVSLTQQDVRSRELRFVDDHYPVLLIAHGHFGRAFKFTEEEFDALYLPWSADIKAYYYVDEVEELYQKLKREALAHLAIDEIKQRAH